MADYTSFPLIRLSGAASIRVTAFLTERPFVSAGVETVTETGTDFARSEFYFSPAKAAEYGAALIAAAKLLGWVEEVAAEGE